jgi:TRAP-type uncharacterized transport system substrate-binding protein
VPRIAALSALLFAGLLFFLTRMTAPPAFDFLAGPEDSTFYSDALRFQELLARDGVTLNVIETKGSVENLELLRVAEGPTAGFIDAVGAILLAEEAAEEAADLEAGPSPPDDEEAAGPVTSLGAIYLQPAWLFTLATAELSGMESLNEMRLGVGPEGSTSRLLANLFAQYVQGDVRIEMIDLAGGDGVVEIDEIVDALRTGQIQAAFVVGQPQNQPVDSLLRAPDLRAVSFRRAEAYALHFPYLLPIRLPEGGHDLGENLPPETVVSLAASTELVVTDLFPPPLADLLLQATGEIYGEASLFTERDAFPNPDMVSITLNSSAARYYDSGPPFLRKYLPFQLATWIDRFIMVVVAFGSIAIALFSIVPRLIAMHLDRQLQAAYRRMEEVEKERVAGTSNPEALLARLDEVDEDTLKIRVYLRSGIASWMETRQYLHDLRERVTEQ